MLNLQVTVNPNLRELPSLMNDIRRLFGSKPYVDAMGINLVKDARNAFRNRANPVTGQGWPGRKGGGQVSGRRIADSVTYRRVGLRTVEVGTDILGGRLWGEGGVVRPKGHPYLAVAVNEAVQAQYETTHNYRTAFPMAYVYQAGDTPDDNKLFLAEGIGGSRRIIAKLMRSKTVPARPYLGPSAQTYAALRYFIESRIAMMMMGERA